MRKTLTTLDFIKSEMLDSLLSGELHFDAVRAVVAVYE